MSWHICLTGSYKVISGPGLEQPVGLFHGQAAGGLFYFNITIML